jgi:hypothetical protein
LPALGGEFIAEPVQLLLAREQVKPGSSPFSRSADPGGGRRLCLMGCSRFVPL